MAPRSFLISFATAFIVCTLVLTWALWESSGKTTGRAQDWTAVIVRDRIALASSDEPLIAVAAGSGGLFGVDAEQLSAETGLGIVNVSTHAALPLNFLEFHILNKFKAGDTVILPLELEYYKPGPPLNGVAVEAAHSLGFGYFWQLPIQQKLQYFRLLSMDFIWNQLTRRASNQPARKAGYWAFPTTPFGDIDLKAAKPDPRSVQNKANKHWIPEDLPEEGTASFCTMVENLVGRGINVFVTPPAVYLDPRNEVPHRRMIESIATTARNCGAHFVAVPGDGSRPLGDMLDTMYHLNAEGRKKRTAELAASLLLTGAVRDQTVASQRGQ